MTRVGVIAPRRWPRRVLIAANVVVAIMLVAAGSVYGYVNWRFGQIKRITLPSIFHAPPQIGP